MAGTFEKRFEVWSQRLQKNLDVPLILAIIGVLFTILVPLPPILLDCLLVLNITLVIQFVVITKGATRISEVAARFTLDAMPGKQLSIDADLNSGLINEEEARRRRRQVTREA